MNREERRARVGAALRELHRDVLRAEELREGLELYVDVGAMESLRSRDWQIVYGRRGTGKTHLFRAMQEQENGRIETEHRLWLYFSLHEVLKSPDARFTQERILAQGYFQQLFQALGQQLVVWVDQRLEDRSFVDRFLGRSEAEVGLARDKIYDVLYSVDFGEVVPAFADLEMSARVSTGEHAISSPRTEPGP